MMKIILVDDDEGIRHSLSVLFKAPDYQFVSFSNGNVILDGLFDLPDIFIIDKQLSGIDGLDLCRHLKSRAATREIPVIIISASRMARRQSEAAGADCFLEKPYSIQRLREAVDSFS